VFQEKYVLKVHPQRKNVLKVNIAKIMHQACILEIVKQATTAHLQMLKQQRILENIYVLQVAIAQKEVVFPLPVLQVHIPQVSVPRLLPIALLALLDKYAVEAVHKIVQLFAMRATIVPWELKIVLWLSMYVIWDMSAQLGRRIKLNVNQAIINH
jgi:hypothetical protein